MVSSTIFSFKPKKKTMNQRLTEAWWWTWSFNWAEWNWSLVGQIVILWKKERI